MRQRLKRGNYSDTETVLLQDRGRKVELLPETL